MKYSIQIIYLVLILIAGCAATEVLRDARESFLLIINERTFSICTEQSCPPSGAAYSSGSGFVIGNYGGATWGMTAGHVCAPRVVGPEGTSNRILINTLKGITFEVHEVVVHQSVDLCILRLPSDLNLPALSISSTAPQIADKVFSISAPLGIAGPDMVPIFEGRYVGKVASPLGLKLDAYAIPANSGSSGGVVLNTKGEIVGMIIMARIGFENFALSVPYELLQRIFKDLESLK